ncbi:SUKH-4 family immunity protein [Kitasatospora saccharophila]|uniref:SUKH-4 family immunity protein n=1 Tax=Kitasatospora saccharophila TaxID=407973 RepID=UPI00363999B6
MAGRRRGGPGGRDAAAAAGRRRPDLAGRRGRGAVRRHHRRPVLGRAVPDPGRPGRAGPGQPPTAFVEDADPAPVDTPHGRLQPLGELYRADVFVHLGDGTIWVADPDSDVEYELAHRDVSSLSYLVYKIAAERPTPEERPTPHDWADVEEIIREDATAWDELPFRAGARFWAAYLDSYPML